MSLLRPGVIKQHKPRIHLQIIFALQTNVFDSPFPQVAAELPNNFAIRVAQPVITTTAMRTHHYDQLQADTSAIQSSTSTTQCDQADTSTIQSANSTTQCDQADKSAIQSSTSTTQCDQADTSTIQSAHLITQCNQADTLAKQSANPTIQFDQADTSPI